VRFLILAAFVMAATPAFAVELFRYRGAAKDGGTLEYVFEAGEQNSPNAVTKEKAAEIAADFMTRFYHVQVGALETQELRTTPVPFWLVCFSDTVKGPLRQLFFVVLLPDGTVVEPRALRSALAPNGFEKNAYAVRCFFRSIIPSNVTPPTAIIDQVEGSGRGSGLGERAKKAPEEVPVRLEPVLPFPFYELLRLLEPTLDELPLCKARFTSACDPSL
jgi:hypothetical protein